MGEWGEVMDKGEEWGPTWAGLVGPMASWAAVQQGGLLLLLFFCFSFVFSFFYLFCSFFYFQFYKITTSA